MVLRNSILYVTLPLALAIGLIWFRRKKLHCDSGGKNKKKEEEKNPSKLNNIEENSCHKEDNIRADLKHSNSVPITGLLRNSSFENSLSKSKSNDSIEFKFGKSAPIDITPNKATPSRNKGSDKQATDSNGSKPKNQTIEYNTLNSIEEHSFDSVDLPGSTDYRRPFSFGNTIKSNEPAVVVKASTIDVHKSPQSSFEVTPSFSSDSSKDLDLNNSLMMKQNGNSEKELNEETKEALERNPSNVQSTSLCNRMAVSSPPLSLCSNKSNHSNESNDSGKGSSPPNSEGGQTMSETLSYDFEILQTFVGYLVGKHGANIQNLKEKTGAIVLIKRHPLKKKLKLCTLKGSQTQIDSALEYLKAKLPIRANLKRVEFDNDISNLLTPEPTLDSALLQVNLIDGINNDVIISTIINAGQLFLQQPLHPSYPSLNILQNCMNQSYSSFESPLLPSYNVDTVCVGIIDGHWYRLQIVEYQADESLCVAKYLDYGGYCQIHTNDLRQIRTDFMTVPFQAIECFLSDIKPKDGAWTEEASNALVELTQFRTLQAQVAGYTEAGLPEIYLYSYLGPSNVVYINQELVARGFAEPAINA